MMTHVTTTHSAIGIPPNAGMVKAVLLFSSSASVLDKSPVFLPPFLLALILVRNLSVENPGKKQLLLETGVSFLQDFFMGILGEEGKQYVPYLMSTVIYIGIANIAGVFGFTPPTKDMNVTIALALMSIILIEYAERCRSDRYFQNVDRKHDRNRLRKAFQETLQSPFMKACILDQTNISLHAVVR